MNKISNSYKIYFDHSRNKFTNKYNPGTYIALSTESMTSTLFTNSKREKA